MNKKIDECTEDTRVNFLNNVLIPGNFTRDELEQTLAHFYAQFRKYEHLVDYYISNKDNKKVIGDIKQALEKTGLYSGKYSNDEENRIFQAFDAGILVRNKTVARSGGDRRAAQLKILKDETIRIYDSGNWGKRSTPDIAKEITPQIVTLSKGEGGLVATTTKPLEWIRAHIKQKKSNLS